MNDKICEQIAREIERSYQSGLVLCLSVSTRRVLLSIGGSGEGLEALVERKLIREASRRSIPVMLGRHDLDRREDRGRSDESVTPLTGTLSRGIDAFPVNPVPIIPSTDEPDNNLSHL